MSETPGRSDVAALREAEREALSKMLWDTTLDELVAVVQPIVAAHMAQAWSEGHAAGRDYQGDGWNSDAHDPERDNPYREKP